MPDDPKITAQDGEEPEEPRGEDPLAVVMGDLLGREVEDHIERARAVGIRNRIPPAVKAKIVMCLATGMTMRETADETGVSRHTITDLNANDREFRDLLEMAEQRAVDAILGDVTTTVKAGIKELGPVALEKLRTALGSDDPRVYMPAARLVLTGGGMVERASGVTVNVNGVENDIGSESPAQGD